MKQQHFPKLVFWALLRCASPVAWARSGFCALGLAIAIAPIALKAPSPVKLVGAAIGFCGGSLSLRLSANHKDREDLVKMQREAILEGRRQQLNAELSNGVVVPAATALPASVPYPPGEAGEKARAIAEPLGLLFQNCIAASSLWRLEFSGSPENIKAALKSVSDLRLFCQLPHNQELRIYLDKGRFVIELPRSQREFPFLRDNLSSLDREGLLLPVGIDLKGRVATVDFARDSASSLLIGGNPGGGKSAYLKSILVALISPSAQRVPVKIALVDLKSVDFQWLAGHPILWRSQANDFEAALNLLEQVLEEMNRRYRAFQELKIASINAYNKKREAIPRILLLVDEMAELLDETIPKDVRAIVLSCLRRISQKGRAAGIFLLGATQKPLASIVDSVVKANCGNRIAFKTATASDSRVILDCGGAEKLLGKGDGLIATDEGDLIRFQSLFVPEQDLPNYSTNRQKLEEIYDSSPDSVSSAPDSVSSAPDSVHQTLSSQGFDAQALSDSVTEWTSSAAKKNAPIRKLSRLSAREIVLILKNDTGLSQKQIVETLWGRKEGGYPAWERAVEEFKQLLQ